jgi:DNA-binding NarL/FixJ family response regulator
MKEEKIVLLQDQPPWLVINNPYKFPGDLIAPTPRAVHANNKPFTDEEKEVLRRRYQEGKSHQQMADEIGRSLSSVGRILRGMKEKGVIT